MRKGLLLVVSGPSGCGKGTILKQVMPEMGLYYSVSMTTRQPREGEVDGVHYHFATKEQFETMIAQGGILEHAIYCDNYYGTPKEEVESMRNAGKDVVLEIEVKGAAQIRKQCPDAIFVFILPPSLTELEHRLRGRGTEAESVIQKRTEAAVAEMKCATNYDYLVVNGTLEDAVAEMKQIISAERIRHIEKEEKVREVLES